MTQTQAAEDWRAGIGEGHYTQIERLLRVRKRAFERERWDLADILAHHLEEMPLSVLVRSGWYSPGEESTPPAEYEILLSTGGPAVRVYGTLNEYGEPDSAELQVQDWFKPWARAAFPTNEDVLIEFARAFWLGEGA